MFKDLHLYYKLQNLFPANRMFKRLQNIVRYSILQDISCLKRITNFYVYEDETYDKFDQFEYKYISMGFCYTAKNRHKYDVKLFKHYDTHYQLIVSQKDKVLFDMKSYARFNEVEPLLGVDITADFIDNLLTDLEQYLQQNFGNIEELIYSSNENHKDRKLLHKQELKKLL